MSLDRKVVLITRKTRYEELIAQYNTESQAAFVIESRGDSFSEYKQEHTRYVEAICDTTKVIQQSCRLQTIDRAYVPNFIFGKGVIKRPLSYRVFNLFEFWERLPYYACSYRVF